MIGRGASLSELMLEALSNLRGQGRRSVLALLGVVIGSAAIVALMNIAHIAQIEALRGFRQTGVDLLSIQRDAANGPGLDVAHLTDLVAADPQALMVVPFASSGTTMRAGAKSYSGAAAGITPQMNDMAGLIPAQGRLLAPVDGCSPVVVVGRTLAAELSAPGAAVEPGSLIHVGGYGYTVVGVLNAVQPQALSPIPFDDAALMPLACARRVMPHDGATGALIRLRPDADAAAAALRESCEEIALAPQQVNVLGYLDPFLTVSGFRVTPVVAVIDPAFVPVPQPDEVAEVFEVPLSFLMDPHNLRSIDIEFRGRPRRVLEYAWPGQRIWGATAAILLNLRRRLEHIA